MHNIDGQIGTLKYIASSPAEMYGGFPAQTVAAAKWALAEIERLQSELSQRLPTRYEADQIKVMLPAERDEALNEIERLSAGNKFLQAEVERLKAAFGPTIEVMESAKRRLETVEQWDFDGYGEPYNSVVKELARLRAIVEKGTE